MALGERVKLILTERKLKQVELADALGVSANYVNQLVNGKKENISETLAKLIEETYGYSSEWVMSGEGEKQARHPLSAAKITLIELIHKMPEDEVTACLAFANTLEQMKRTFFTDKEQESVSLR